MKEKIHDGNISEHFKRYSKSRAQRDAHKIYLSTFAGEMATISRPDSPAAGYPMGSVAPFIIDHTGNPVIYTANVAEHSKNAEDNGKASILVREIGKNHNVETGWRLVSMGDLKKVDDSEVERVANSYFRHYPNAKSYAVAHSFYFYRLNVKIARVIMGFGRISWIDAEALCQPSVFDEKTETRIIGHMNDDHGDAIEHYLKHLRVKIEPNAQAPKMAAINQFGATLRYRKHLYFLAFDEPANDALAVREQLVKLAKA
ncbi:MAG: hypothetical protein CSA47_00730 [Gammaproteobacteria bacterium]|nr:MAG: hypothetical protein CSA47_00730 [Gammaproteobacteria bacterium]